MIRFLLGLLVGAIAGVAGTTYFFSHSGGDYLLLSSQRVLRLEQERDQVAKKLEDTASLTEKIAEKFTELEQRFQKLAEANQKPASEQPSEQPAPATVQPEEVVPEVTTPPS